MDHLARTLPCMRSVYNNYTRMWKIKWSTMTRAWDKEKKLSPRQESNPWPPEHRAGALSTEPQELMESKALSSPSWKCTFTFIYHNSWRNRHCWSLQYTGRVSYMNSVKWPHSQCVLVAQKIKRPPGVRSVHQKLRYSKAIPNGEL